MDKVIDLTYLKDIADNDNDVIIELVTIFLDQIDEFKDGFAEFFHKKDWRQLAALAHKAKSSVISMGMNELGEDDLKNLEIISKFLLVNELENLETKDEKIVEELGFLKKSISNISEKKLIWVKNNTNKETIEFLIEKFNKICCQAKTEIEDFLKKS